MKLTDLREQEDEPQWERPKAQSVEVRAVYLPLIQKEIDKLNRKATKLGVPPVNLKVLDKVLKPVKGADGIADAKGPKEEWLVVDIEGEGPNVPGYEFLATIQHTENGNIIRMAPNKTPNPKVADFYNSNPNYCDHCRKRRNRIDTFIIQDAQGNLRQIGRNCLADFLGGRDPKSILFWFRRIDDIQNIIDEVNERQGGGSRHHLQYSIGEVLTIGAALVRTFGYIKRPREYDGPDQSTVTAVRTVLNPPLERYRSSLDEHWLEVGGNPTEQDKQTVKAVLEWFNNIPQSEKDSNTFFHNIDVYVKNGHVTQRDIGFIVALLAAYSRAKNFAQQKEPKQQKSNEHVGQVGQKIGPIKVNVIRTRLLDSQFGTTQLCAMEDDNGNLFNWFNSGRSRMEEGKTYNIAGAVKKHDDYQGRKQTVLTRVKFEEIA